MTQGRNRYIILLCQVENGHAITTTQLGAIYGYGYIPHLCHQILCYFKPIVKCQITPSGITCHSSQLFDSTLALCYHNFEHMSISYPFHR